jgi:hypothetical protein
MDMNKRLLLIIMIMMFPTLLTACSTEGGPLAAVYTGQSTHYYPRAFQPTLAATTQVLGQMHCVILSTESAGTSSQGRVIHARNGHMLVDVTITPKGPQVTAVATRFGLLGSVQDDQRFHFLLKSALGLG